MQLEKFPALGESECQKMTAARIGAPEREIRLVQYACRVGIRKEYQLRLECLRVRLADGAANRGITLAAPVILVRYA